MSMAWNFEVSPNPGVEALEEPEPAPVYRVYPSQPFVAVPGVVNPALGARPGSIPGTYYIPGPGGPRWFSVVPVPR